METSRAGDRDWARVWGDEFNGPDGSPVDPGRWTFETGGNSFGNNELEYYAKRSKNAAIRGGDSDPRIHGEIHLWRGRNPAIPFSAGSKLKPSFGRVWTI